MAQLAASRGMVIPMTALYTRKNDAFVDYVLTSPMPSGNIKRFYASGGLFSDLHVSGTELEVELFAETSDDLANWTKTVLSDNLLSEEGPFFRVRTTAALPTAAYVRVGVQFRRNVPSSGEIEVVTFEMNLTPSDV